MTAHEVLRDFRKHMLDSPADYEAYQAALARWVNSGPVNAPGGAKTSQTIQTTQKAPKPSPGANLTHLSPVPESKEPL
jgi:hypothetical protein